MSNEHPDRQIADSADTPAQTWSIPRWAGIAIALILLLPVLAMSSMMLLMGLFGPPMHGGIAAAGPGLFPLVGAIPLLLALAVIYGVYRLYAAETK